VWRKDPRILYEMTTLRKTLQTRRTDNQELDPSERRGFNETYLSCLLQEAAVFVIDLMIRGPAKAEITRNDTSSRWVRRKNHFVLKLDKCLAGRGHCNNRLHKWRKWCCGGVVVERGEID
jgi:hypothetical protein